MLTRVTNLEYLQSESQYLYFSYGETKVTACLADHVSSVISWGVGNVGRENKTPHEFYRYECREISRDGTDCLKRSQEGSSPIEVVALVKVYLCRSEGVG